MVHFPVPSLISGGETMSTELELTSLSFPLNGSFQINSDWYVADGCSTYFNITPSWRVTPNNPFLLILFLIIMGYLWYKTWNKTTGVLRENLLAPWIPGAHRLDRRSSPCTISTQKPPTGSRISKPLQMSRVTELWYNLVTWGLRGNAGCTSLLVKKLKKKLYTFPLCNLQ